METKQYKCKIDYVCNEIVVLENKCIFYDKKYSFNDLIILSNICNINIEQKSLCEKFNKVILKNSNFIKSNDNKRIQEIDYIFDLKKCCEYIHSNNVSEYVYSFLLKQLNSNVEFRRLIESKLKIEKLIGHFGIDEYEYYRISFKGLDKISEFKFKSGVEKTDKKYNDFLSYIIVDYYIMEVINNFNIGIDNDKRRCLTWSDR